MKNLNINWRNTVFTAMTIVVFIFAGSLLATAQDRNQTYTLGELIEAKYGETWLKAKIIDEKSGGYIVRFAVDRTESFVQKDRMRPLAGAKPQNTVGGFKVGDKLEVELNGVWNSGEIIAVKGDAYRVRLSRYSERQDEWYTRPQMRRLGGEPVTPKEETGKTVGTQVDPLNNEERGVNKYKPGDRVECDKAGIAYWQKGTVMPFLKNDATDGMLYRVRLDDYARGGMYLEGIECYAVNMRLLAGAAPYKNAATAVPVGKASVDEDNTLSADRPIMECPVTQTPVKNGAAPNTELFKKIIRCKKGEKTAAKGKDGAVTVDVTALQIGAPRPWIYGQDLGGKPGTKIYPVKATFHYKTFYRSGTEVSQNWIRIFNFYVNAFGEWEIGSEESVKMGETVNIPRDQ